MSGPKPAVHYQQYFGMNTRLGIILCGVAELEAQVCFSRIQAALWHWESILSRFDPNAETYRMNQAAFGADFSLSSDLYEAIVSAIVFREKTGRLFDIFYPSSDHAQRDISSLLCLDQQHQTIRFASEDVQVDFGGMGKGLFLKQVREILDQLQIEHAFVSFGESSIDARGNQPEEEGWTIRLNPEHGFDQQINLKDSSLSISGMHGIKAHISDQQGDFPQAGAVAVHTPCPMLGEAYSTALYLNHDLEVNADPEVLSVYFGQERNTGIMTDI